MEDRRLHVPDRRRRRRRRRRGYKRRGRGPALVAEWARGAIVAARCVVEDADRSFTIMREWARSAVSAAALGEEYAACSGGHRRGAASQSSPRASRAPGATTQPLLSMAGAPEKDDVGAATMTSGRHGPSQAKKREVTYPDGSGRTPLHLNSIRTLGIHFRCPSYRAKRPHGDARARVPRKYVSDDNSARSRSPDTPGRSPWLDSRSAPRLPTISSSSKSSSVPYHDVAPS